MPRSGLIAASVGGEFTPARHGSALKLWRRADLGVTEGTPPDVTAWADQVAGGDSATVPGGGVNPHLIDPKQNGLPGVDFGDPASAAVGISANDNAIDDFWAGSGDKMLILAIHMDDSTFNPQMISKGHSAGDSGETGWLLRGENGSAGGPYRVRFAHEFTTLDYDTLTTTTIGHGGALITFVWDGTSGDPTHLRVNGADAFDLAANGTGSIESDSNADLFTGSRANLNGANLRGAVLEYYFVSPAPSTITDDETYLNAKWALF